MTDEGALRTDVLRGIGYMCVAVAVLPFLNAAAKWLLAELPVVQVVWARYAVHLLFAAVVFMPSRGWTVFRTGRPGVQVLRSSLLLGCTALYFTALRFIDLPTAVAINFTSPLIVTVLAVPMLGERVGWRRWAAVAVGFGGALVIIRPGLGAVHPAGLLVLGTATLYAVYQILTRRVSAFDPPQTSVIYMAVVGTLGTTVLLPWFWAPPPGATGWLVLLSTGAFAAVGHFFVVRAFEHAPASIVSPFSYGQLVGAAILGYAIFGDVPDRWTWLGSVLIVASGLYIAYRESVRRGAG